MFVDLFIAHGLMVSSSEERGAICWVGLSAPVVALSCSPHHLSAVIGVSVLLEVCCVHLPGAPHREEAPTQQDTNHNTARFHP